jgi:hypothetical protein
MNDRINTRLAVIDALAWPVLIAAYLVVQSDYEVGGLHGLAFVVLGIWAMRKVGWALDGYREPEGERWTTFNPFNPVSVILAGMCIFLGPKAGQYSYTTTTLIVWWLAFMAFGAVVKLAT